MVEEANQGEWNRGSSELADLFTDDERPAYTWVAQFHQTYGQLPSWSALQASGSVETTLWPSVSDPARYYRDRVKRRAVQVRAQTAVAQIIRAVDQQQIADLPAIFRECTRELERLALGVQVRTLAELETEQLSRIDQLRRHGQATIPTGFPSFDRLFGGWVRGDFNLIAGRLGSGKTYLLLKCALAAIQAGRRVVFISTEMPRDGIWSRVVALAGRGDRSVGLNSRWLLLGQLSEWGARGLQTTVEELRETLACFGLVSDQFTRSFASVRSAVEESRPDLVMIDGLRLLRVPGKFSSQWEQVAALADEAKTLALEYHVPVVATVQMNRVAATKKRGGRGAEHLAGSDVLGQNASVVMDITIPQRDGLDMQDRREITILKGRDGESGSFTIAYEPQRAHFDEIEPLGRRVIEQVGEPEEDS